MSSTSLFFFISLIWSNGAIGDSGVDQTGSALKDAKDAGVLVDKKNEQCDAH